LESAARSADVISCATLAAQPLVHGRWLKSNCHVDLVGSFKPDMREADDECMRGSLVAVDTFSALEDSGDLIGPLLSGVLSAQSVCLLNDLAAHAPAVRAGRTVFKSVGVAHADLAAAEHIYQRHLAGV
jgi:ornithine cyclodeaminase